MAATVLPNGCHWSRIEIFDDVAFGDLVVDSKLAWVNVSLLLPGRSEFGILLRGVAPVEDGEFFPQIQLVGSPAVETDWNDLILFSATAATNPLKLDEMGYYRLTVPVKAVNFRLNCTSAPTAGSYSAWIIT
jgi:hypothetical protein